MVDEATQYIKKNLSEDKIRDLILAANHARQYAYAPYSKFAVGAALLGEVSVCNSCGDTGWTERIYTGCNVENAAFTPGNCAERTAVFKAVSEGCKRFYAIAIVAGSLGSDGLKQAGYTSPCGVCRQVLREFVNPEEFLVIMARSETDYRVMTLEALLPESFGPANIEFSGGQEVE